jgi:hypothetical protein
VLFDEEVDELLADFIGSRHDDKPRNSPFVYCRSDN